MTNHDDKPAAAPPPPLPSLRRQLFIIVLALVLAGVVGYSLIERSTPQHEAAKPAPAADGTSFKPSDTQWGGLVVEPVAMKAFRAEVVTDGKIAIDENHATPVFSPYSGQVRRLAVEPGENVKAGQLLFTIEATDMVQAENDFITALAGLSQAQSQVKLAEINEQRQHELFKATAGPLKDWQQAQADLVAAQSSLKSAEIALEAVRNRLRILKKTEAEIDEFQKTGKINAETPIYAPIGGAVVQRKVGPGQFITAGTSDPNGDPVFVIGDLTTVWLVANVREADATTVSVGQDVEFRVQAAPGRVYKAKVSFASEVLDAATRRLAVRATVDNPDRSLKPEMFTRVTILTGAEETSPAVPPSAIVYEGDGARVWVETGSRTLEPRTVTLGLSSSGQIQVLTGLKAGDRIVTKGTLFIDRAAAG